MARSICLGCGLEIDPAGNLAINRRDASGLGCDPAAGANGGLFVDHGCGLELSGNQLVVDLDPNGGITCGPNGLAVSSVPSGAVGSIGADGGSNGSPANCDGLWNALGTPFRTSEEASAVDTVSGIFPANFEGDYGATPSSTLTNTSNCKPMAWFLSYYAGCVIQAGAGTEDFTIIYEYNIDGGPFSSPFRVGIGFPGQTPRPSHEIIQESQGLGFLRKQGVLAPGQSVTVQSRVTARTTNANGAQILFVDRVHSLMGWIEF